MMNQRLMPSQLFTEAERVVDLRRARSEAVDHVGLLGLGAGGSHYHETACNFAKRRKTHISIIPYHSDSRRKTGYRKPIFASQFSLENS